MFADVLRRCMNEELCQYWSLHRICERETGRERESDREKLKARIFIPELKIKFHSESTLTDTLTANSSHSHYSKIV